MELTPIKVRGKRRAKGEYLVTPLAQRRKDQSHKKRIKTRRPKASNIEKSMPLEVLERIFWFSENISLPRASPRLGLLLSGRSTLRETFLSAFGPTWDVWFGCIVGQGKDIPTVHSYVGWKEDTDRFGGNPSFQTDLLACSWTTIDMILDCWDTWVRRHARNLPFEHIPLWGNPITPSSNADSGVTTGVSHIKEARHYFYHDYQAFRDFELQSTSSNPVFLYRAGINAYTWIEVHRSTEIPDGLITGSWDEGSLQKFFWLVQAGAHLSPRQTWELTREGFHNALSDEYAPNLTAIRLLQILGAFREWPEYVRQEEVSTVDAIVRALNERTYMTPLYAKYGYMKWLLTQMDD